MKILLFVACLSVITCWAAYRTQVLLSKTLERNVARQASDLSVMAEERFGQEFHTLSLAAGLLSSVSDPMTTERVLSELRGKTSGVSVGLLSIEGKPLAGSPLSQWDFLTVTRALRGQTAVDYCTGRGILFAVPVRHGGNVRAVLYRLYSDTVLSEQFKLTEYHPSIHLLLCDKTGEHIIPYKQYDEMAIAFFDDPVTRDAYMQIRGQLDTKRAAAITVKHDGQTYFLFASDLPETNCTVAGYIPWSAVAGDIALIHERLLRSIGILLLFFIAAGMYLFHLGKKAHVADALRREKEFADQANRAKGEFLANMSHEIRTPINAVLGMNEMVLREGKDPTVSRYARNIRSAGQTLLDIINDVLDFSKIESGKLEIIEGAYRLSDLIDNTVNIAKPRAEGKGLSFSLEVDETLPDALVGDVTRIQQVLINLLTNAAKYTEKGGVRLCVLGQRQTTGDILSLRFEIHDTGIGIRDEDKGRLFKGFERLDGVRNRSIEGTGLGLAITKRLATLMGGDVVFESTYGVGSVFTVTLPQKITNDEPIGDLAARLAEDRDESSYRASFTAPTAHILVVDDNEMNLLVVEGLLKATGIVIDSVTDGPAALERLASNRYDAVLLDHRMPGMDGIETLQAAKALPNTEGTPFLILTADAVSGSREMFLREGFDDYLAKPLDVAALEQTMIKYLPKDKVTLASPDDDASGASPTSAPESEGEPLRPADPEDVAPLLDIDLAIRYCSTITLYRKIASLFLETHRKNRALIEEAFANESWKDYAAYMRALKSSSLSIGGKRLSEKATVMESKSKLLFAEDAGAEEREEARIYLREHQAKLTALYDEFAEHVRYDLARRK